MDEELLETEGTRCEDSEPLTPTQETLIILAHYSVFVTVYIGFFCTYAKLDILKQRIWSPLLLFTSSIFLIICPGFEIGDHYFTEPLPWELKEAPSNLINGSFAFFNVGGICLMTLAIRKIGVPFFRVPSFSNGVLAGLLDLVAMLGDIACAVLVVAQPFLYASLGRLRAQGFTTPINTVSGILILFRLWKNLGPNKYTAIGGIGYLVATLSGVFILKFGYEEKCVEFIHFFIGGSFSLSSIFFSIAVYNAVAPPDDNEEITNENTPLNRV